MAPADVHAHVLAQVREAGVHLGRDGARPRAKPRVRGPNAGMPLGQVFQDRERIPDVRLAVHQDGHLAGRRMLEDLLLAARPVERHAQLAERDAEHLHRQPGPQRPGRVVLVADDQEHPGALSAWRGCAAPGSARAGRPARARTAPALRARRARCRRGNGVLHTLGTCIERTLSRVISLTGSSSSIRACAMDSRSPRPMTRRLRPVMAQTVSTSSRSVYCLGPAEVVALALRIAVVERREKGPHHVADVHRLEARLRAREHDHRQELRQQREQVEEGILGTEDHRGPEHGDREILRGQRRALADALGAQVLGGRLRVGAERAHVQQALHARDAAGVDHRLRELDVHPREIGTVVVRAALVAPPAPAVQHAGKIDDRVAARGELLQHARLIDVGLAPPRPWAGGRGAWRARAAAPAP